MTLPIEGMLVRLPGRRIVVCKPNYKAYGHLAIELQYGLDVARKASADLLIVRPAEVVSDALYEMRADDIRVIVPSARLRSLSMSLWSALAWILPAPRGTVHGTRYTRERWAKDLGRWLDARAKSWGWSKPRRAVLRRWTQRALGVAVPLDVSRVYFRRRLLSEAPKLELREPVCAEAIRVAARLGIGPSDRVVTLHVRGAGFKLGRESQDKSRAMRAERIRDDSTRNADVTTYYDAVDHLVGLGYRVVRIGDPSMEPVQRPGLVDLATSPERTQALELYLLGRSEFLLGSESGPQAVVFVTGTPSLILNATDPISSYPIRGTDMYLLKDVVDIETDQPLPLESLLSPGYQSDLRNTNRFRYVDNTSAEVLASVREMLALLAGRAAEDDFQRKFRLRATAAAVDLREEHKYARKWGVDEGLLGAGRIAAVAAPRSSDVRAARTSAPTPAEV